MWTKVLRTKEVKRTSKPKEKINVQANGSGACLERSRRITQTSRKVPFRRCTKTAQNLESVYWGIVGGDPAGPAERRCQGPAKSTGGRAQSSVGTPRLLTRGVNIDWQNRRCVGADGPKGVHSRRNGIGRPEEVGHTRSPARQVGH